MELQAFKVNTRKESGKGPARQSRMKGGVPGVLYGGSEGPISLAFDRRNFEILLHKHVGGHAVVQLEVEDEPLLNTPALVKSVQRHPVNESIIHADFLRISLDERIHTSVPVEVRGQAKGVVDGGVLEHQLREVDIECLALEVPEHIEVDVSHLKIGESIHVADLQVPESITVITDSARTVVSVHAPRVVKVAAVTEEAVEGEAPAEEPASE